MAEERKAGPDFKGHAYLIESASEEPLAEVRKPAPDFKAQAYVAGEFQEISLSDYKGRWVVLFFYPLDFTFVCPTELKAFAESHAAFEKENVQVLAASVDSVYSHKAWFERDMPEVKYPVIGDITKSISRDYGVLNEEAGVALRGTFIINPEGTLVYSLISDLGLGRSTEETLRVVQAAKTGELCPANWRPGQKTLGKG
jgi:alkyl hydroperoxide reductase subunit AhpC